MSEMPNNENLNNQNNLESTNQATDADTQKKMEKEKKKQKMVRARKKRKVANIIMGVIVFGILLGALSGFSIINVILSKTDVVLNTNELSSNDSSLIYDDAGNQIAIIGKENRISYSYDKLPQNVIDAFVAVEDSRFFEHPGFDVPRFAKAFLENIKSLSFAQGGSTLTMQVIKNTYFAVDTIAPKGIDRKVQEIYYSLKINNIVSKEKIFELYVNKVNFGANARGIQVASQYYFGKDCTKLSLIESAMLAGIINLPNSNNPYYNLDNCTKRTHEVLYQMKNHGYITEEEYNFARNIKIENLLAGKVDTYYGTGKTVRNQAYIDVVLAELADRYNINPYVTPVKVYTAMNQTVQDYCDAFADEQVTEFCSPYCNGSLVLMQNYTGRIVGLCGGRDYDGVRMFNYAYDNRVNPGSTAKGIITYPLAFEYTNLGTNLYHDHEPLAWAGTNSIISEDGGYVGRVSTQRAYTTSYNAIAVKLWRSVEEAAGIQTIKEYMRSIGIDSRCIDIYTPNEMYAIGEQNLLMSPIQIAAAESVILSKGLYTEPHVIDRIEFINSTEEPIVADPVQRQVLSEGAAWLSKYLEQVSVNGKSVGGAASDWTTNGRLAMIRKSAYTVYGKTGTSLYDSTIRSKYHWPHSAAKDWLMMGGTNDYSFCFWMGFDTGQYIDETCYISSAYKRQRHDGLTVSGLLDAAYEAFGKPVNGNNRPSSVISITHVKGMTEYCSPPAYCPENMITSSFVLATNANVVEYNPASEIPAPESLMANYSATTNSITATISAYPDPSALTVAESTYKKEINGRTYTFFYGYHPSWVDGVIKYQFELWKPDGTVAEEVIQVDPLAANSARFTNIKPMLNTDQTYIIKACYYYDISGVMGPVVQQTVTVKGLIPDNGGDEPGNDPGNGTINPINPVNPQSSNSFIK